MSQVEFISGDIAKVIANLRNTRTVDPHGVNNIFIKRLRLDLARPLSIIYHAGLTDCLHGLLHAPFLLSYSVFDLIFPYFSFLGHALD